MSNPLLRLASMVLGLATLLAGPAQASSQAFALDDVIFAEHQLFQVTAEELASHSNDQAAFVQASADYVQGNDRSAIASLGDYLADNPDDLLALRMLTDLYVRSDEDTLALALLGRHPKLVASDTSLSVTLLQLYLNHGRIEDARELLATLEHSGAEKRLLATLQAEIHLVQGDPAAALAILPERDYRALPLSYGLLRGAALLALDQLPQAAQAAGELGATFPGSIEVHNFAALVHLRRGADEAAQRAIDTALALDATNVDARFHKAVLLAFREQPKEAERLLDGVLADQPGHERAMMLKVSVLHQQGRSEEALRWSEQIHNYDISSSVPEEFQLQLYIDRQQWPEALKTVEQLLLVDPDNASYRHTQTVIYTAMGDAAQQQGLSEQAQSHYMQAYTLDTNNTTAILRLYELSLHGVGGAEFIEVMEAALEESTLAPWMVRLLADSYLAQGQPEPAARYYEALLTHPEYRENPDVLNNLANAYATRDLDRALSLAKRALRAEQVASPEVLDTLGWIHVLRREYEQAMPHLRRALDLSGSDPGIRYHMAMALAGLGRNGDARTELNMALNEGDEFADRADAERLLNTLAE